MNFEERIAYGGSKNAGMIAFVDEQWQKEHKTKITLKSFTKNFGTMPSREEKESLYSICQILAEKIGDFNLLFRVSNKKTYTEAINLFPTKFGTFRNQDFQYEGKIEETMQAIWTDLQENEAKYKAYLGDDFCVEDCTISVVPKAKTDIVTITEHPNDEKVYVDVQADKLSGTIRDNAGSRWGFVHENGALRATGKDPNYAMRPIAERAFETYKKIRELGILPPDALNFELGNVYKSSFLNPIEYGIPKNPLFEVKKFADTLLYSDNTAFPADFMQIADAMKYRVMGEVLEMEAYHLCARDIRTLSNTWQLTDLKTKIGDKNIVLSTWYNNTDHVRDFSGLIKEIEAKIVGYIPYTGGEWGVHDVDASFNHGHLHNAQNALKNDGFTAMGLSTGEGFLPRTPNHEFGTLPPVLLSEKPMLFAANKSGLAVKKESDTYTLIEANLE